MVLLSVQDFSRCFSASVTTGFGKEGILRRQKLVRISAHLSLRNGPCGQCGTIGSCMHNSSVAGLTSKSRCP